VAGIFDGWRTPGTNVFGDGTSPEGNPDKIFAEAEALGTPVGEMGPESVQALADIMATAPLDAVVDPKCMDIVDVICPSPLEVSTPPPCIVHAADRATHHPATLQVAMIHGHSSSQLA
jgi:hypothetical protein